MTFTGTPAAFASSRPSVAVVPPTSPEALSTEPSTGLPVNTATRSVPVGASWDFCAAVGAGGALAQPARNTARTVNFLMRASSYVLLYCIGPGEASLQSGDAHEPGARRIRNSRLLARRGWAGQQGRLREARGGQERRNRGAEEGQDRARTAENVSRAAAGGVEEADRRPRAAEGPAADGQPAGQVAVRRAGAQPHRRGQARRASGAPVQGHAHGRRRRAAVLRLRPRGPQGHRQGGAEEGRRGGEGLRR